MFIIMVFCVLINLFFVVVNTAHFLNGDAVGGFVALFNLCVAVYCGRVAWIVIK